MLYEAESNAFAKTKSFKSFFVPICFNVSYSFSLSLIFS